MGYTHYFTKKRDFTDDEWQNIRSAARAIIGHQDCPDIAFEYDETDKPAQVDNDCIRFNGVGDDGHETFDIHRAGHGGFSFCKTAQKPYDVAVVACLIAVDHFAPGALKIGSDGDSEEWQDGLNLARTATGIERLAIPQL